VTPVTVSSLAVMFAVVVIDAGNWYLLAAAPDNVSPVTVTVAPVTTLTPLNVAAYELEFKVTTSDPTTLDPNE
jgi:hypothetical protein